MPEILSYWACVFSRACNDTYQFLALHKLLATLGTPLLAPIIAWKVFGVRSMTDAARLCVSVLMAYGFVLLLTFLWHLIVTPPTLASEQTRIISAQQKQIEHLSSSRNQRETFASLMNEAQILMEASFRATDPNALGKYIPDQLEWVGKTITALNEAGLDTDAVIFEQSGKRPPSPTEMFAFEHLQNWKRYQVAQFDLYRKALHEIIKRRDL